MNHVDARPPADSEGTPGTDRPGGRRIDSASLFRGREEIVITHSGREYRLRITRADKLILTK